MFDLDPALAQHAERGPVEQEDQRPEQPEAEPHRQERAHRQPLRVPQRDGLRQQLAEDHLHRGDGDEHCDHSGTATAHRAEGGFDQRGQLCLAVGAGDQAAEGDADLARRDVGVEAAGVGHDRQQATRRPLPDSAAS